MSQSAQRWIRCHTGLPLLTAHPVPWAMLPWQMCPHGCCELHLSKPRENLGGSFLHRAQLSLELSKPQQVTTQG